MTERRTDKRPRVWVVDDSPAQAEIARRALSAHYDVEVFVDGATAIERLATAAPDLLVLDWHMPHVSGGDVCRFVRESRDPSVLPILILTATSDRRDVVAAFEVGANDFVRKPFDDAELNARVAGLERSQRLHFQLKAAEESLREEAQMRERFIAALGHDLRQPLGAITASAEGMIRGGEQSSRAPRMLRAAQRMARMIEDVLDLSRVRLGGGLVLRPVETSLEAIAELAAEEARAANAERSIVTRYSNDLAGEWDVDRLAQLCGNLLDNALKHGARDSAVHLVASGNEHSVTMVIENQGLPIAEEVRASLFDAFRQGDTSARTSGLGLGLFIVDQIARAHGGSVEVMSDENSTRFTVTLPRKFSPPPA